MAKSLQELRAVISFSLFIAVAVPADAQVPLIDLANAYSECTAAVRVSVDEALTKCDAPARGGVTGAQYIMGALLTNRGAGDDMVRGVEWLEKAVAAGSLPAAHQLAIILLQSRDGDSAARAGQLLRSAVCAGYPQAIETLRKAGVNRDSLLCPPAADTDFAGDWTLNLKWDKAGPTGPSTAAYRVTINGPDAHVYIQGEGKWVEVKPGKFTVADHDQSLTIAATDTGWDYDGKWIETWTFQLMRTAPDEAAVAYMRTVNNPYLPSRLSWKTFSTFAEGTATRKAQ